MQADELTFVFGIDALRNAIAAIEKMKQEDPDTNYAWLLTIGAVPDGVSVEWTNLHAGIGPVVAEADETVTLMYNGKVDTWTHNHEKEAP